VVAHLPSKQTVAGSSPVSRSWGMCAPNPPGGGAFHLWQLGGALVWRGGRGCTDRIGHFGILFG
jgi:hypothetical protein